MAYSKYYVYTLAYPDGRVFYVGKGQGDRIDQHEKEARRYQNDPEVTKYLPKESAKVRTIRKIWASGGRVIKTKVFQTDDEQEANEYEQHLIAQYGREHLTNQTKGGGPQFSSLDPYARIKHREYYYSPKEACEKLGVSQAVWSRLVQAGVLHFYQAEGCSLPVLDRREINDFADKIRTGAYPIDAWEMASRGKETSFRSYQASSEKTENERPMSRVEMQQEAASIALQAAQQASSEQCYPAGSYEKGPGELAWDIRIRKGQREYIYTVKLQQNQFIVVNVVEAGLGG